MDRRKFLNTLSAGAAASIAGATTLTAKADALEEAKRRQALRGIQRHRFTALVQQASDFATIDLGDVVTLQSDRLELSDGEDLVILSVAPDGAGNDVTLGMWG